ncbi:DUF3592 domain-containing protein [Tomitella fengzijianii]|uniref:DUF3592 domain-containing protein n=1 Tax=Tomitella fengzijianii TaxID=2597660 RepID=A0A516X7F0_9ACTN|nr:DUF3592 domain-containing protein [Tomitella fengzijianii]QDQ98992.1 DUF3592 domain-containing protein [Tomitella fengzijianii]
MRWPKITRRAGRRIVIGVAVVVTVLGIVLLLACWRTDRAIESDMGTASAEVLSAGHLRSSISFATPDGVTHNPPTGVLYPTGLTQGQFIEVEYDRGDPDMVRVKGRDAAVAVVPVGSVVLCTWLAAGATLLVLRLRSRRQAERRQVASHG